ncbi:nucleoid-associated protein [sulfur-oxidizing endosymbiont of Gigantopelta aegis]|uniref:nucleoid-associated protein n=1 Tax=sulfur-oxidizing endosymbiont of Gigantopelta aegis TaxID=2794934 RepID=UPI001BE439D6|nr:nucleoid-associated protein [sulfur-oxidizing endosymbiont of Gigantopelta aegis]
MIIKNIVVHLIDKQVDAGPSTLSLSEHGLEPSKTLEGFLEDLNKIYNAKPSKVFGRFVETHDNDASADEAVNSNKNLLSGYLDEQINFIEYTQQSMNLLKHYIDQASKATGGYIVFVHYTLFGSDFMMVVMLNNVAGIAINDELGINAVDYLDINKLHLAARVDLSLWQEAPDSDRYISMIKGIESNKLSEYFCKFIGSDETINSKKETSELLSAVNQFCDDHIQDEEEKSQFKQKSADFCLEQADKGQNVVLKDFSGYVADSAVDDFMNYIKSEQYELNNEISPNKTVIRRFNKISGRNQQVSITINEEALGNTVIYDAEKETLTFSDLPASLKAQILNR